MDFFTILSFALMALLFIVPFFFVYLFAKRLEKYFNIRSVLFISGFACALLSFSLLLADSLINPASIELGSGIYLSEINLAGAFFSLIASISFYLLTEEVFRALGMQSEKLTTTIPFVTILFAAYFALSLSTVKEPLSLSLNFIFSVSSFVFLFLSFYDLAEIYGSLASTYKAPALIASYLVLWHLFYQTFGFILYLFPSEMSTSPFNYAQISITTATIILLAIPAWKMAKTLKITVTQEVSPFLNRISLLIGGSALTILKKAIEEYNREHSASVSYDDKRGVVNASEDFMEFMVSYFERYIGPVAKRIYSELEP